MMTTDNSPASAPGITVFCDRPSDSNLRFIAPNGEQHIFHCTIGKNGFCAADEKTEGDGKTPLGNYFLRNALLRADRLSDVSPLPVLPLPWRWTAADDGWSDDGRDPNYNRPVRLDGRYGEGGEQGYSAENLQRDDMLYDVIITISHNDSPPVPGMGSAIFFHVQNTEKPAEKRYTLGCVALKKADMLAILPQLQANMPFSIIAEKWQG